jgi:PAS domain S-box-containing protein
MNDVMLKLHPIERHTWIAGGLLTLLIAALAYVLISRDIHSQRSMELLERSESRQRAIVEMLPIPIALSNNGVGVTFVNAAFTDTFGYSQQDIPTVERWREMAFPDPEYRSKVIQEWRIGLRHAEEGAGIFVPQQLNIRCKDGADKTVLGLVTPLSFALHGEKLTVYHDITKEVQATKALQRALKDNVGLLNEVHHRVKNNLQVITSLLRLEASRSNKEEVRSVLQDMQGRIRSMSLLHESLYRSGQFAHVHLAAYLTQLVSLAMRAFMSNEGGVQVRMDMSPLEVALDRATPLGLVLNELLSNCMKHAFPDGAGGEIHISLSPVEGTPSIWLLRVRDTGVGLASAVEPGRSQSMGLQLVFDLAEQIGGKATLQNATGGGAEFAMRFESCARSTDGVAL